MKKKITIITIAILLTSNLFGQEQKDSIQSEAQIAVISKVVKDTIMLRWGPTDPLAWEYTNQYGYIIEKYTMVRNGKLLKAFNKQILTPSPLKPEPMEQWEEETEQNEYAAIAAQAIYGETFELESKTTDVYQMINKAKETENRFSFALFAADQSFKVAQMSALAFIDTDIKPNERYLYKIYSPVPHEYMAIDTGYIFLDASEYTKLTPPAELEGIFNDRTAFLTWNTLYDKGLYTGYIIERSDDNGNTFTRVNKNPFVNTSPSEDKTKNMAFYLDSLPEFNKEYYYRVKGITPFGDIGTASDAIHGKVLEKLPAKPFINSYNVIQNKHVLLKWEFPTEFNPEIKGFKLYRSKKISGTFKKIDIEIVSQEKGKRVSSEFIGADKREYILENINKVNYIMVVTIDHHGTEYKSSPVLIQLEDNLPPLSPQEVRGSIDSTGMVTIQWKKNTEEDLLGYRVFTSNSKKTEFMQITTDAIADTFFTTQIELKTLSKHIYYRIVASDFHGNHSEFSDILQLERPDIVPPAQAFFTGVSQTDTCVYLEWKNSASNDISSLILERKNKGNGNKEIVIEFEGDSLPEHYADYSAEKGITYEYAIIVEDFTGNKTYSSKNVTAGIIDKGFKKEITEITTEIDRENLHIKLSWDYPYKNVYKYYIYRAFDDIPLHMYKTIPGDNSSFTDTNLKLNTTYTYRIRAEFKKGAGSPFSKAVIVKF